MSSILPPSYWEYLEYLPNLQKASSFFIVITPLFSYGTTCYGIYSKKTSTGFSLDICATMLMSSILRIFYYMVRPFEVAILCQSFVMIFIQSILLKTSLHYRSNYNTFHLEQSPIFYNELNSKLPSRLGVSYRGHESYFNESFVVSIRDLMNDYFRCLLAYIQVILYQFLSLFDSCYKRPLLFWQWQEEGKYWAFLAKFSGLFGILTLILHKSYHYGAFIGFIGLFMESLLPLPQILLLNRYRSIKNFKSMLLLSWLGGDCTKIGYLLFGARDISSIFISAALFQMILDLIIAFQYFYFKKSEDNHILPISTNIELQAP